MVVSQAAYDGGNMAIPADGIVISADKAATANIEKLRSLKPGDEITVNYSLSLPSYGNLKPEGVQEIIGGDVKILREGETVMEANRWINPRDAFNPRTLIGYDKERTMLVICAIDGRSTISGGTTYPQGADLMRSYGCYDALDFDGGGSTLMWDAMEGTINRPCVSPERAVGNGIFAVLHAPDDEEVAEIRFADYAVRMPRYGSYRPVSTDITNMANSSIWMLTASRFPATARLARLWQTDPLSMPPAAARMCLQLRWEQ